VIQASDPRWVEAEFPDERRTIVREAVVIVIKETMVYSHTKDAITASKFQIEFFVF
jgi:hypothetical protein